MTALQTRPATLPLAHKIAISTVDVDELESYIDSGGVLERRRLTILDSRRAVNAHMSQSNLNHLKLMGVHLGANVIARSVPLAAAQVVIPVNGKIVDRTGEEALLANTGEAAIFHMPNRPVEVEWQENTSALVVRIPSDYLAAIYRSLTGDEMPRDLSLKPDIQLKQDNGPGLLNILNSLVSASAVNDRETQQVQQLGLWEELLVTTLLTSDPSVRQSLNERKQAVPVCGYLKRTADYIQANIRKNFSMDELLTQSGVSIRTLQKGFKECYGQGPMSFVREKKLEGVYRELLRSDDSNVGVADVARQWGFQHASYFTRIYKRQFGELPSDTLGRRLDKVVVST